MPPPPQLPLELIYFSSQPPKFGRAGSWDALELGQLSARLVEEDPLFFAVSSFRENFCDRILPAGNSVPRATGA